MTGKGSVLLAAGGTGGHLFPAQALAEELRRRGREVDLVTDMRGDRYGIGFPARQIYRVPSATLAGGSPVAMARTGLMLARGLASSFGLLGKIKGLAATPHSRRFGRRSCARYQLRCTSRTRSSAGPTACSPRA
jgi:UDP-N-acetylglucosamine--N-acetylmuramyl-(pentapeptide) pyrophosphoryl-undecaprenol N-acetylglucosamine transferase